MTTTGVGLRRLVLAGAFGMSESSLNDSSKLNNLNVEETHKTWARTAYDWTLDNAGGIALLAATAGIAAICKRPLTAALHNMAIEDSLAEASTLKAAFSPLTAPREELSALAVARAASEREAAATVNLQDVRTARAISTMSEDDLMVGFSGAMSPADMENIRLANAARGMSLGSTSVGRSEAQAALSSSRSKPWEILSGGKDTTAPTFALRDPELAAKPALQASAEQPLKVQKIKLVVDNGAEAPLAESTTVRPELNFRSIEGGKSTSFQFDRSKFDALIAAIEQRK